MTGRVPRQRRAEDRREALVVAATQLASTQGPAACTARAVATAAGLPLASVSYYFADLSVLVAEAVRRVCRNWRDHAQDVAARAGAAGAARAAGAAGPAGDSVRATDLDRERLALVIAAVILPPREPGSASASVSELPPPADRAAGAGLPARATVATRYRHLLAAADNPVVTVEMATLRIDLVTVVATLLPPCRAGIADLLVTVVDGAALGAIAEGDPDPARRVVAAVATTLDQLL